MGELAFALDSLDRALAIKPNCDYAWNHRGIVLLKLARYEAAITSFNKSLASKPNNPDVWYSKARCYALLGEITLALTYLQHAIKLNPPLYNAMAKVDPIFGKLKTTKVG